MFSAKVLDVSSVTDSANDGLGGEATQGDLLNVTPTGNWVEGRVLARDETVWNRSTGEEGDSYSDTESDTESSLECNHSSIEDHQAKDHVPPVWPPPPRSVMNLVVQEGKHRMVRRLLHNAGHSVVGLQRLRFGGISLGTLGVGECRPITDEEVHWVVRLFAKVRVVKLPPKLRKDRVGVEMDSGNRNGQTRQVGEQSGDKSTGQSGRVKATAKKTTEKQQGKDGGEFKIRGRDQKEIDTWTLGSLGRKSSRRFQ